MPKYNTPTDFESGGFDIFLNEIDPTDIYSDAMVDSGEVTDGIGNSLILVLELLKAQYTYYQACHWESGGTSSYGDHLLFERLYNSVSGEVDTVGERVIANTGSIDITSQTGAVAEIIYKWVQLGQDYVTTALRSEVDLRLALTTLIDDTNAEKSYGIANMAQGIFDTHETHIYLLQQRLTDTLSKSATKVAKKVRIKKASLEGYMKMSHNTLINKSEKDFWKVRKDATGGYVIEKLYDSEVV